MDLTTIRLTHRLRTPVAIAILAALVACGGGSSSSDSAMDQDTAADTPDTDDNTASPTPDPLSFSATLVKDAVVTGSGSAYTAQASISFDEASSTLSISIDADTGSELNTLTVALHQGGVGVQGEEIQSAGLSSAEAPQISNLVLTDTQVTALLNDELYLTLNTTEDATVPVLRGQIHEGDSNFGFHLASSFQVVPLDSTSTRAHVAYAYDESDKALDIGVNIQGDDQVTEVQLYQGIAGTNGSFIASLMNDASIGELWRLDGQVLNDAQATALAASELYIVINTEGNAQGAARAQLVAQDMEVFFTRIDGSFVLPPVASDAVAYAATTINDTTRLLSSYINTVGLDDAFAAHIHTGAVDEQGGVYASYQADPTDVSHWLVDSITLSEADLATLNTQGFYINIHTPEYSGGEVRGQLVRSEGDELTPLLQASSPLSGATQTSFPTSIIVNLNRSIDANSIGNSTFTLLASGGDGSFDDGNETTVSIQQTVLSGTNSLIITPVDNGDQNESYLLRISSSDGASLTDTDGIILDGDADGIAGGDYLLRFSVLSSIDLVDPVAATFTDVYSNVITIAGCASAGCHTGSSPAAGMDLSSQSLAYSNIVNISSTQVDSLNRITPNDADNSYIVQKVEGTAAVGARMPRGRDPLTAEQISLLRSWVDAGALDN